MIFDLGDLNDEGLYSWTTIYTNGDVPRLYILVRDLDDFAANDEEAVLQMCRDKGFFFDDEAPNENSVDGMEPVLKSNNDCIVADK